jgi:hypothetical protein
MFIMMIIMNLFSHLMKLFLYDNHVDLQPQVIIHPKQMDLNQLQHLLVFKTNHHTPIFIWYPLIYKWNDFTYSTSWNNSVTSTIDHIINQILYHIYNMLNPKQHPQLFDRESFIHKTLGHQDQYLV